MKENNEVASVLKDTKKLNESSRVFRERIAGIAFLALQSLDDRDGVSDKYIPATKPLTLSQSMKYNC